MKQRLDAAEIINQDAARRQAYEDGEVAATTPTPDPPPSPP